MEIKFTKHALERLNERNIDEKQVLKTIENPEVKTAESENLTAVYKKFDNLALKVVYKEEEGELKIVTVHWIAKERLKKLKLIIEGEI